MRRTIVLVDGEHHPTVVADALRELAAEREIAAVAFCGGEEKVADGVLDHPREHYGHDLVRDGGPESALRAAIALGPADEVVDLADEPVVTADTKLRLAEIAGAAGLAYRGPDMPVGPARRERIDFAGPQISVIGTGKRTGKTAVCCHLARLVDAAGGAPAVVSMGRGGPPEPLVELPPVTLAKLLALSRSGVHAASDYLEDAVLAGVPTVGCRRVGGGPAGSAWSTNFPEGARRAARLERVRTLLYEGSGAVIPPVEPDRHVVVAGPGGQASATGGPLRIRLGALVLAPAGDAEALAAVRAEARGRVVEFTMTPEPAQPVPGGARVAVFTTRAGPPPGLDVALASTALARRAELETDIARAVAAGCELFLAELKAAAIDTVAEAAERHGIAFGFVRNRPIAAGADAGADLDELLLNVWREAADG
jgi:cyclic 2,3-diphosphoglycerate synthetase